MEDIQLKIKAAQIAAEIQIDNIDKFLLQNPLKLESALLREVAHQYLLHKKMNLKIPAWNTEKILINYSKLSLEQSSSSQTAAHKFNHLKLNNTLDLTAGFGTDAYHLAKVSKKHTLVEQNKGLLAVVEQNFALLGLTNVKFVNSYAEDFLEKIQEKYDLIYLDPDRRDAKNQKLVGLADCSPNVELIYERLLQVGDKVFIKLSPLIDLKLILNKLPHCYEIELIAIKNELKEILVKIDSKQKATLPKVSSINYLNEQQYEKLEFSAEEIDKNCHTFTNTGQFLYEPNVCLMKSGAFAYLEQIYKIKKLAANSHFYFSDNLNELFQGRKFKILSIEPFKPKELKKLKGERFNVVSRNFPFSADQLRKQLDLKEGKDDFLIFTQDSKNQKIVINCVRIF